jgi:hypothetical protein
MPLVASGGGEDVSISTRNESGILFIEDLLDSVTTFPEADSSSGRSPAASCKIMLRAAERLIPT